MVLVSYLAILSVYPLCTAFHRDKTQLGKTYKGFSVRVFYCTEVPTDRNLYHNGGTEGLLKLGLCDDKDIRRRWGKAASEDSEYIQAYGVC